MVAFNGPTAATSKVSFREVSCTATVIMCGKTDADMKVTIDSIRSMVKAYTLTRTGASIAANGKTECSMVLAASSMLSQHMRGRASGPSGNSSNGLNQSSRADPAV